jgi:hypothetical protein
MSANTERTIKKPGSKRSESFCDSEAVERYLKALVHPLRPEVEALRKIILKADGRVAEGIKWNAPSFFCGDWFATFDLRSKAWLQIIFHRGAKVKLVKSERYVKDSGGILKWISNDRCAAKFVSKEDVAPKAAALTEVVAEWVQNLSDEAEQA